MRRSDHHILTTHTGSLPRAERLRAMVVARERGQPYDVDRFESVVRDEVLRVVRQQRDAGLDVVNDGEQSKASFHRYRFDRLSGFEFVDHPPLPRYGRPAMREARDFPEFYERWGRQWRGDSDGDGEEPAGTLCCTGPVGWKGFAEAERDIANLLAVAAATGGPAADGGAGEVFMTSISPATYAPPNLHYDSQEAYLDALADAMAVEYRAIIEAGIVLQIDAPDLTTMYRLADLSPTEYAAITERSVEAINRATRDLPADRIRVHVCWGADEAPHHRDVPLCDIVGLLLRLRPQGLAVPGANGRHSHEWRVWADVGLPDGKVLIPGVIDSTSNIIEHPEAVAERIARYEQAVGRPNLIAGVDCGFGTVAGVYQVDERVAWAKLRSLAEGARLASGRS